MQRGGFACFPPLCFLHHSLLSERLEQAVLNEESGPGADLGFLIQLVFCKKKKKLCGVLVLK